MKSKFLLALIIGLIPIQVKCAIDNNDSADQVTTGLAASTFISNSAGTIMAWVKPSGTTPPVTNIWDGGAIVGDCVVGGGYFGLLRTNIVSVANKIWAYNYDGTGDRAGADYTVDEWAHFAWVHTGGVLYLYKNGVWVSSTTSGNTSSLTNTLRFGCPENTSNTNNFRGEIDDVRIYSRVLSDSEIESIALSRARIFITNGQTGYWRFDQGLDGVTVPTGADLILDISGNNRHGTAIDDPVWRTSSWISYP